MSDLASLLQSLGTALPGYLLQGLLVSSAAILLVLALRQPWRRWLGARHAPLLWALVPASLIALLLPAPEHYKTGSIMLEWLPAQASTVSATSSLIETRASAGNTTWLWWLWAMGGTGFACVLAAQQYGFHRRLGRLQVRPDGSLLATSKDAGPAVIGLLRPRVVLPADFEQRYDLTQQSMILCHEYSHLRRGDVPANALASALRCIYWFNPLVHYAANRLRHDHELAADAAVVARFPQHRKTYAETLLKVQLAAPGLPVGCLWQSSHPLKERIAMLKAKPTSFARNFTALSLASALIVGSAGVVWAAKPAQTDAAKSSDHIDASYRRLSPPGYP